MRPPTVPSLMPAKKHCSRVQCLLFRHDACNLGKGVYLLHGGAIETARGLFHAADISFVVGQRLYIPGLQIYVNGVYPVPLIVRLSSVNPFVGCPALRASPGRSEIGTTNFCKACSRLVKVVSSTFCPYSDAYHFRFLKSRSSAPCADIKLGNNAPISCV